LRDASHYVFQAPVARGAYYGPHVFAGAMWERVAKVVEHHDGPFVLIGMSRGGLVALDAGMRIVSELGKVASVLCLSAPLDVPGQIPRAVSTIAGFEGMLLRLGELLPEASRPVRRFAEGCVQRFHLLLTTLILTDFEIDDPRHLQLQLAELEEYGVLAGSLRAAREFRLLLAATRRDGQLFCQQVANVAAQGAGALYAALLWGARDTWIDSNVCQAKLQEAMRREPTHDCLETELVPDQGHALGRTRHDTAQLAHWLRRVAERAEQGAKASRMRAQHSEQLETRLSRCGGKS
jgi:alpha-beta hydrolase superfamily lysophospholipase